MKTIPIALQANYSGTPTPAIALRLTRADGTVYGFTGAQRKVTISGVTYSAVRGLDETSLSSTAGFAVDNLEMRTIDDGSVITRSDIQNGLWRGASFLLFRYDWKAALSSTITLADVEPLFAGVLGNITPGNGTITVELRGLQQYLQQPIGSVTSRTCRARFADYPSPAGVNRCRLDSADYIDTITVNAATSRREFNATDSLIVVGDANYDKATIGLHLNGTNGSTTFTDVRGNTVTAHGTAQISTAQAVFGGASARFDGGGYLTIAYASGVLDLGSTPYSLVYRLRFDALPGSPQVVCGQNNYGVSGEWDMRILTDGRLQLTAPDGSPIVISAALSPATWYAVKVTDDGITTRLFVDGAVVSYSSTRITGSTKALGIGAASNGNAKLSGYIDEFRLFVSVATSTSAYTVETAEFLDVQAVGTVKAADWYGEGIVTWLTGANAGASQKVKSYSVDGDFVLMLPMAEEIAAGDTLQVIAGCRKRRTEDCGTKFGNVVNFAGEPDLPGVDAIAAVPDVNV